MEWFQHVRSRNYTRYNLVLPTRNHRFQLVWYVSLWVTRVTPNSASHRIEHRFDLVAARYIQIKLTGGMVKDKSGKVLLKEPVWKPAELDGLEQI